MVPKQGLWVRVGVREGGNYVVLLIGVLGHGGDEVSCVGGTLRCNVWVGHIHYTMSCKFS